MSPHLAGEAWVLYLEDTQGAPSSFPITGGLGLDPGLGKPLALTRTVRAAAIAAAKHWIISNESPQTFTSTPDTKEITAWKLTR